MILQAYKINGQTINVDIFNWRNNQLNGNKPWIVSETLREGYTDISSIVSWYEIGHNVKDYTYVRERIRDLYNQIGYENLTQQEKDIVSYLFISSKIERGVILSEEEEEEFNKWCVLIENSQECRLKRWETAKKYISFKLTQINSSDLANSTSKLCYEYINYNITTKIEDGVSGLFDYLKGEGDYTLTGYPSKSYWTQQDQDKIMDILENGNY
jgi:hypothetical protein